MVWRYQRSWKLGFGLSLILIEYTLDFHQNLKRLYFQFPEREDEDKEV